jgi:uncharacterized protein DUF3617
MRTSILMGLIFASYIVSRRTDKIQPLDVKLGLWEVTTAATTGGQIPVPAEVLAKLTPGQRARIEERLKAQSSGTTKTTTRRQCLTKEQLDKGATFGEERKSCTRTVLTSTSSRLDLRVECADQGRTSEGTLQIEALDSENVRGTAQSMFSGDHTLNPGSTFTARWIGPICKR